MPQFLATRLSIATAGLFAKFQRLRRHYKKNKEAVAIKNATALFLFKTGKERRRESFYRPYSGLYLCHWRRDDRLLSLLHHYEPDDRLRLVFIDRVALVTANTATPAAASLALTHPALFAQAQTINAAHAHWKREELIMAVGKEHIYIIQGNSAAAATEPRPSLQRPCPAPGRAWCMTASRPRKIVGLRSGECWLRRYSALRRRIAATGTAPPIQIKSERRAHTAACTAPLHSARLSCGRIGVQGGKLLLAESIRCVGH